MPSSNTSTSFGNAPSGGYQAGKPAQPNPAAAQAAAFAIRHVLNEHAVEHFAYGVAGIIAIFAISYWGRRAYKAAARGSGTVRTVAYPFVSITRLLRSILLRPLPGFTSCGHAMTILAYTTINVAIAFTHVEVTSYPALANRFGWMITANLVVLCFLALKNTPFSFLIGYSYERLNVLHQACGYTTVLFMILHGVMYTIYFMTSGMPYMMRRASDVAGIVAGFGMAVMFIMPVLLKGSHYEVFYASHVTSFVVVIITAALHQSDLAWGVAVMTVIAGSLWAADRIFRAGRIAVNSIGNYAKLYPLPNGGTRVVVRRGPRRAIPGQHCFLWIPGARRCETHPFSIVSSQPTLEFVVDARNGFTRDLHALALKCPDTEVLASVDGPYGRFPDPLTFNRVVLIAGGNGASFVFGVLGNLLGRMSNSHATRVEFTWTIRERAQLSWYQSNLDSIKRHAHYAKLDLTLHITREEAPSAEAEEEVTTTTFSKDIEKDLEKTVSYSLENGVRTINEHFHRTRYGRPEIRETIQEAIARAAPEERVLVVGCGPTSLMKAVRHAVGASIRPGGAGVELHCEQFGW